VITKDNRYYYVDGKPLVRVTEVLSILDRPGLDLWRGNIGNGEAESRRDQAADIGTEAHSLIHRVNNGNPILSPEWSMLSIELQNSLRAYKQAQAALKFKPVQSELFLATIDYAGTTDCLVKIGKEHWLLDWKTGTIRDPRTHEVYPEIHFQLAAYYYAYQGTLAGCMAIRLNKDTGVFTKDDAFTITEPQLSHAYACFCGLLETWYYINKRRDYDDIGQIRHDRKIT